MRDPRLLAPLCAGALLLLVPASPARAQTDDVFAADVRALCSGPHRLAGSPEAAAAADYLIGRLRAAGLSNLLVQTFGVPRVDGSVSLEVDGHPVPVFPLRENLWILPGAGGEPIEGESVYAGDGAPESYGEGDPHGRVVVLDYASSRRWRDAFAGGARAVLFVESPAGSRIEGGGRGEPICADEPRFYVRRADAEAAGLLTSGRRVRIVSNQHWSLAEERNVLAWIPGCRPTFGLESEEAIVLAARTDSYGEVPGLACGARDAANCAALLEIARDLAVRPPSRHVLLAFLGGEGRYLSGAAALYRAIFRQQPFLSYTLTHADLQRDYAGERAFLDRIAAALGADRVLAGDGEAGRHAVDRLRVEAQAQAEELRNRLRAARAAATPDPERIDALRSDETAWNALRRSIGRGTLVPGAHDTLARCRALVLANLEARHAEIDTLVRRSREAEAIGGRLADKAIVLHLDLDFGDDGPRWGLSHRDDYGLDGAAANNVGYYVGLFGALSEFVTGSGSAAMRHIEPATAHIQFGSSIYAPGPGLYGGQMASRFGVFGLRLATCHDPLRHAGQPTDNPTQIDAARIAALALDARPLLRGLADSPVFSLRQRIRPSVFFAEPAWSGNRIQGYNLMARSGMGTIANRPARGAWLAKMCRADTYVPGFDPAQRYRADQNGCVALGPWPCNSIRDYPRWCAAVSGTDGVMRAANVRISDLRRIELFPCRPMTFVGMAPPLFSTTVSVALNAANDGLFPATDYFSQEVGSVATFFVPAEARGVKVVNRHGLILLQADADRPAGRGLSLAAPAQPRERASADDLRLLNESRLDILRRRRITNDSLEWLHGLAAQSIERAQSARKQVERTVSASVAGLLEHRVYTPLLATINDLVQAVVILLLLTIPFAYALERLFIGTPHIYRQVGWYVFFFLAMFVVLYLVHPAFAIAAEPIIIFLAFAIILLSALVIFILLSRFQAEIKVLQGMRASVHAADVSRFGTVMAAVAMGISTMRRRPVRTVLTTVTVILLTFSILSFASFDAQQGVLRRYVGSAASVRAAFIHHALWTRLSDRDADLARDAAGPGGVVTERRWVSAATALDAETFGVLLATTNGGATAVLKALVGVEPPDVLRQPDLRAALPAARSATAFAEDAIFLPPAVSDLLRVKPGDPLRVGGRVCQFAGAFDADALTRFTQIDRSSIFPVDYTDKSLGDQERALANSPDQARIIEGANRSSDSTYLPCLSANQIALVHSRSLLRPDARLVALSVYPDASSDLLSLAERLCRTCWAPVYATLPDGVHRLYFTTLVATAGLGNLLIPILLGGLIVLGTMLGSVADRAKEIQAFSALGLAPAHIGMLFFAESAVYAVVGGLGGYTLAQTVSVATAWIGRHTGLSLPEMNYSSNNAIFAILVVMATVMLSTAYPARRGARSANPGVARFWRLPRPDGDNWEFTFPFTVSEHDIQGVISFLYEHFQTFHDCSLGVFLAEDTQVRRDGRSLVLTSRVATAPFDLGVTETFALSSLPSEIEGVDDVRISIRRLSGTPGDWRRTNKPFIADLRRQFLIWRSLTADTMEHYRQRTRTLIEGSEEGTARHG